MASMDYACSINKSIGKVNQSSLLKILSPTFYQITGRRSCLSLLNSIIRISTLRFGAFFYDHQSTIAYGRVECLEEQGEIPPLGFYFI